MRVLISTCSSFWISREAVERARQLDALWAFPDKIALRGEPGCLNDKTDREENYTLACEVPRHDPILLQVFNELGGERMSGWEGDKIVCLEIPDDVRYYVDSYCGEWIAEQHRVWGQDYDAGVEGRPAGTPYSAFTKDSVFKPLGA